jgi:hypothetical protein
MIKGATVMVLGLLVAGCSSKSTSNNGTGGDGGADAGNFAQACTDRATQYCSRLYTCSPERIQAEWGDQGTCVTRQTENCNNSVAVPGTGNMAASIEACSQAYASWDCEDFLDTTNIPTACQQVTGSVASGSPCVAPGECTTGFCAIVPGATCGVCATAPASGDSCAELTTCGQGLDCTTDTHTCVVLGGSGATCGKGAPCGALFTCIGSDTTTGVTGTCQASITTLGAMCDPDDKTGPACDRNSLLTCNTATKECATMIVAAGGAPCGTNVVNDQTALCSTHGTCTGSTATAAGTCTAAAADGDMCDLVNGPSCLEDARCITTSDASTSGTCEQLNPTACP